MRHLTCFICLTLALSSSAVFGQSFTMDWYLGDWTTSEPNADIPRFEIIGESANTLLIKLFKDCVTEDCVWESVSSTPVSAVDAELDPVKNADMLNGAFISSSEKVFFDFTAMSDDLILAEINILTAEGPKSLMLEYERVKGPNGISSANNEITTGGSIYGTLLSEQNKCSDYSLVVFNPETGKNHLLKPQPVTGVFKLEGLKDGSYYYSVNLPEGSKEKSRFESDNPNNPIIIVNGEAIQINISVKPESLFEDKTELTSN